MQAVALSSWGMWHDAQEQRFKKTLRNVLLAALLLSIIVPVLSVPELLRQDKEAIPPRVAKLLVQKRTIKQAPPPVKAVEKAPQSVPQPKKPPQQKTPSKPQPAVKKPAPDPAAQRQQARKKAASAGVLAFSRELQGLRDQSVISQIRQSATQQRRASREPQMRRVDVAQLARQKSASIAAGETSGKIENVQLAARQAVEIKSELAAGNTVKPGDELGQTRTNEEIRLVLMQHYASLQSLYNRALLKRADLKGRFTFELTIAPSGKVTKVRMVSSELNAPALERKFLIKLRRMNFAAKDVDTFVITTWLDFLPS